MSKILILGCGEMAWGRRSPLFNRQWNRGRLSDKICFGFDGPQPGEVPGLDWVTLAAELDRRTAWRPAKALGPKPSITVLRGEPTRAPSLPSWSELAGIQARWATRELEGAGVLVTPEEWSESDDGRQLLAAWSDEGWLWAPLEKVLERRFSSDARFLSASGSWLRVMQREGGLIFANGAEAALALEMASAILERALAELGLGLAERWRREEEPRSGWYVHQQITHKIVKALRGGWGRVELGGSSLFRFSRDGRLIVDPAGTSGVLFRFSSAEAQDRYQVLSTLRLKVELPALAIPWWEEVSRPGFLRSVQGDFHPGIGWSDRRTVLLEGMEIHQLESYLRPLAPEKVAPARLAEALELGSLLPWRAQEAVPKAPPARATGEKPAAGERVEPAGSRPSPETGASPKSAPAPVAEPGVEAPPGERPGAREAGVEAPPPPVSPESAEPAQKVELVTALTSFQPQQFSLDIPHRPGRVQVWLDGELVEQGNVRRSVRGEGLYTIEGVSVPHGAIVRVDFEPFQE